MLIREAGILDTSLIAKEMPNEITSAVAQSPQAVLNIILMAIQERKSMINMMIEEKSILRDITATDKTEISILDNTKVSHFKLEIFFIFKTLI
jgi:hypothetical protein